jgi:uncharacterized phage protein (TIGR01671 family)
MREIKFRAWDIEFERWARPEDISIQGDGQAWIDRRASDYGDVIDTIDGSEQGAIIEQFTGLHDSKGREIYEGDIVRYSNRTESGVAKISSWIGNNLYFEWINSPESPTNADIFGCAEELEVIGNIHESA